MPSKFCAWIKPNVSVLWLWNWVNETSMLLPKHVLNNFAKNMFFLKDKIKTVSDQ